MSSARATVVAAALVGSACVAGMGGLGCAGGSPLLHPAKTLPTGEVRAVSGISATVVPGPFADRIRGAQGAVAAGYTPNNPEGVSSGHAAGAVIAAAVAPGLAPFVAGRVGIGDRFEGGLTYTGRGARADVRRSFDDGPWSLSIGAGLTGTLYGRQQGTDVPGVDLGRLHGVGADIPVLVGWESLGGLYSVWAGARAGFERDWLEAQTSEPKTEQLGGNPLSLKATRVYGAGVFGFATGFRHVHVALEMDVAYQYVDGSFGDVDATIHGITLVPGTALWWTF